MGKLCVHVDMSCLPHISTHSVTYSVEIKQISRAVKGISPSLLLSLALSPINTPLPPSPRSMLFLVGLQKDKALFSHHAGSVVFHKEEICTSCLGDVGFLCRRPDSMVLPRIPCSSAVLLSGFALVERERLEVR